MKTSETPRTILRRLSPIAIGMLFAVLTSQPVIASVDGIGDARGHELKDASRTQAATRPFQYLQLAGSTFHPWNSNTPYEYSGNGCIHASGSPTTHPVHKVMLPDGATIKYVRLYYYDSAPGKKISVFLTTYDRSGNFAELDVTESNNDGGYGTTLSGELNHVVTTSDEALNLVANLGTMNNASLQFCGVRIAYYAPLGEAVFADGFE